MNSDRTTSTGRTRRDCLRLGGAVGAGLIAGCISESDPSASDADGEDAPSNGTGGTPADSPAGSASYSVSIEPMGSVTFEEVPGTWVANNGSWADMGIALGVESPEAVWMSSRYHTKFYDPIPDVSVDASEIDSLYQSGGVDKERFYEYGADVHVMDPNFLQNRFKGWAESDVEEIRSGVAPFFGNCIYAQHYPWHDGYRYYTLYEAFEKLAQVFQRTDRYEAFEEIDSEFRSNLAPHVPSGGDRPEVAVLWPASEEPDQPESFYPYVVGGGTGFEHFRALNARDALAGTDVKDFHASRAPIDLETLIEIDPPVLMLRGYEARTESEFRDSVVSFLQDHDVASQLTAVQNGDVYRAGGLYQGPITYMVVTERTAKQLYGVEEELFDRQRVSDVVNGDV